ncbi:hypothetical protein INT43_000069 [Umbelopsis isabellina]|uniref:Uncharacterized protein n=1 Tax=Mortierella isabellina TaxID=91625 RepID=A0A8H7PEZ9_MORIS|nr:hypothetical protein INT43_000069 [Umbelopsis isabellina]
MASFKHTDHVTVPGSQDSIVANHRIAETHSSNKAEKTRSACAGRQKDNSLRSTSSSPGRPAFSKTPSSKGFSHNSVNGFNGREIEQHLNTKYQAVMNAHHDLSNSERERPEKHSSGEPAWGSKNAVLNDGKDGKTMASGQDFLVQLQRLIEH